MKKILLVLSIFLSPAALCHQNRVMVPGIPKFVKAAVFYTIGLWLLGETLFDCGHRYLHYKKVAQEYQWILLKDSAGRLTKQEIRNCAILQSISSIPMIFWREMATGAISVCLLYYGTKSLLERESITSDQGITKDN